MEAVPENYRKQLSLRTKKPTIRHVRSVKTQISLRIRAVWSESSLIACAFYSLRAIDREMNKNPCHTKWMYKLILVLPGHTGLIVGFVVRWLIQYMNCNVRKRTFGHVRPANIQINMCILTVWSESSLGAFWITKDSRFLHANKEDSDQTTRMHRLIWIFVGRTCKNIMKTSLYICPLLYSKTGVYRGMHYFFLFLLKNIDCGYSLEPPRWGGSN